MHSLWTPQYAMPDHSQPRANRSAERAYSADAGVAAQKATTLAMSITAGTIFIQRHDLALTLSNRHRLRNLLPWTLCPGTWRCHRARWIGKPRKQGSVRTAERLAGLSCHPAEFHHLCCLPVSLASWTDSVLDRVPLADPETRPPEGHRYWRAGP